MSLRLFCDKFLFEITPKSLAQIATKIPQAAELFLASTEERPKEAPYVMLQEKFCVEELKCKAGKAPKKLNQISSFEAFQY